MIEPTRVPIPESDAQWRRYPTIQGKLNYPTYLNELKKKRGLAFPKRAKPLFVFVIQVYLEELMVELRKGIAVWLPQQIGLIELGVTMGPFRTRRKSESPTNPFLLHITWRKRDGLRYPALFQLRLTKDEGYRLSVYYKAHPEELLKLRQE